MQIGEASAASGCHIETIRYYERVGLLSSPARTSGGYRAYRPEAVQRLRFITRAAPFVSTRCQGAPGLPRVRFIDKSRTPRRAP